MTTHPDPQIKNKKVFIVDEHPMVRDWVASLVNQAPGLAVCGEAGTAAEAIQAIGALKPDLAVVDFSLKDSMGVELIPSLKKDHPNLLVLVLSAHDESVYAARALRAGAIGYIMKREPASKVTEAICRVLQGKFYMSEAVAYAITARFVEDKPLSAGSPIDQLSDRELAVFEALGAGHSTREIAGTFQVSIKTVQCYCARIKRKLSVHTGTALLREALRHKESEDSG